MENFPNIQMTMAAGEPEGPKGSEPIDSISIRTCPDCGAEGMGSYCSVCGEQLESSLPPVRHYLKELVHDVAAFDSKLVRTVPALLFRPGFLTKEYIVGRRNRYLAPSRLYLLTGLIVFFFLGSYLHKAFDTETSKPNKNVHYAFGNESNEDAKRDINKFISLAITVSPYVILLGSTPFFAFILRLLYRKKRPLYVEHLVFSFHFFAFALIVLVAGILLVSNIATIIGFVLFFVYLFVAMKRVYVDKGIGLVLRFATVSASYFALASFAIVTSCIVALLLGIYTGDLPDLRNSSRGPHVRDSILADTNKGNFHFYFGK